MRWGQVREAQPFHLLQSLRRVLSSFQPMQHVMPLVARRIPCICNRVQKDTLSWFRNPPYLRKVRSVCFLIGYHAIWNWGIGNLISRTVNIRLWIITACQVLYPGHDCAVGNEKWKCLVTKWSWPCNSRSRDRRPSRDAWSRVLLQY